MLITQREETGPAVGAGGAGQGLPRTTRLGLPSRLTYLGRLQAVTWGTLKNKTQMQCQSPNSAPHFPEPLLFCLFLTLCVSRH